MDFKHRRIALQDVDFTDNEYRISTPRSAAALVPSVRSLGLINPPVLTPKGGRFSIVTGFRRLDACRQAGMTHIDCRLMPPEAGPAQYAAVSIADNALQRELNLVEQANAVRLLSRCHETTSQLVAAAQACGLTVNPDMVRKLLAVGRMPQILQDAILDGSIAFPVALQLDRLEPARDAAAMIQLLLELRVGLNRQREILEWVAAITRRDDLSMEQFLNTGELQRIRTHGETDRPLKSRRIRQFIRKCRYPTISRYEQRHADTVQSLQLQKGTRLTAPAHFEGRTYGLIFEFQSYDELCLKQKEFDRILKSSAIRDLWSDPD